MDFDKLARGYSDLVQKQIPLVGQRHDYFIKAKADLLVRLCERHLGPPQKLKILDAGCGNGLAERHLAGRFGALHAVDASAAMIEEARRIAPAADYAVADAFAMPYADATFDAVTAICVFHHIAPARQAALVCELSRVTRPGGLVIIMEHNPYNPLTSWSVRHSPVDVDATMLPLGRTKSLLAGCGLGIKAAGYMIFLPYDTIATALVERAFSWCPLGGQYYAAGRKR